MTDIRYTKDHEWVAVDGGVATIGITAYAAQQLGDIVYVDLPAVGAQLVAGRVAGEVESTKSVGEIYAPFDGEVIERNETTVDDPGVVGADPTGLGWLFRMRFAELPELLTAEQYEELIAG